MDEFDAFFKEVRRLMEDLIRELDRSMEEGAPLFYGVRVTVGPDGIPKFERLEPVRPKKKRAKRPLTDIRTIDNKVYVIMELQGISNPKNVRVACDGNLLKVRARENDIGYAKNVVLPFPVDPKSMKATFRNGILEIVCERGTPGNEIVITPQ